jgi:hypothetical protein
MQYLSGQFLDGEEIKLALDCGRGLKRDASGLRSGFVLTTHRLIYVTGSFLQRRVGVAALADVRSIEVTQRGRSLKALALSVVLAVLGGAMLVLALTDPIGHALSDVVSPAGRSLSAGPDTAGAPGAAEYVNGILGNFTGLFSGAFRAGGLGLLLLTPLAFLYFLFSGEITLTANLGGDRVSFHLTRSNLARAQAFINVFFRWKAHAQHRQTPAVPARRLTQPLRAAA